MNKKLVLIDGHSILNRAFFGLPDLTNSQGVYTGGVYGFLNIMFKILEEEQPNYLTVAFDVSVPTFRHKMFDGYKGTRKPMKPELKQQVPLIKQMLSAMGITIVEKPGYEADDLLGTLSKRAEQAGIDVTIISGDRDLLQLATEHVMIRIPKTSSKIGTFVENYHAADVVEKYGVTPTEFIDLKALQGDSADNIPGVPGIGEKTAGELIKKYHSIEAVHADAANVKPPRASKNIVEFWELAVLCKKLATIDTNVPIEYDICSAVLDSVSSLYTKEAYDLCKELEFRNLLSRFNVDDFQPQNSDIVNKFKNISTLKDAKDVFAKAADKHVGISISITKQEMMLEQLSLFEQSSCEETVAAAIAFSDEDIYFVMTGDDISSDFIKDEIKNLIKTANVSAFDLKRMLHDLEINDISIDDRPKFFDASIAAYLLNPLLGEYTYDSVARNYIGLITSEPLEKSGKSKSKEADDYTTEELMVDACYKAYTAYKTKDVLLQKLEAQNMKKLFDEVEMPLVFVLYDMEKEGIIADASKLKEYEITLTKFIDELEEKIYSMAGQEFNINSPKQLGTILFENLNIPAPKKTKTGYSTAADVLEKLAPDYPIVSEILQYRQLTKLRSTYAVGLAECIDENSRIHTTFNQTVAATGRLSSTDPNLQNIPIRLELGKMIRKVFYPKEGCVFIDSDYSQIELRLLAHMSGDETMIEAFKNGLDIHRSTASIVFDTPFDEVTPLQRGNAKAVNFGIVYGISAFGLAKDLNIENKEAQKYIDSYFKKYPKIKAFLDKSVESAKDKGYTTTLFDRIRPIPELSSSNFMKRQFGERVAMNSPVQGTAADIIKIAMIRVHDRLLKEGLSSKLILQVHDELLIEAPESEKDRVVIILEEEMQKAANLDVTLEVGTQCGYDWYDAH